MAFMEYLIRTFGICEGSLEVLALILDVAAYFVGTTTLKKRGHAEEKLSHDPRAHIKKPSWWPFAILLGCGIAFTGLVVCKWFILSP
jgi:hypothetical protein